MATLRLQRKYLSYILFLKNSINAQAYDEAPRFVGRLPLCKFSSGANQENLIFGIALAVEAQQGQLITGELAVRELTLQKILDRGAEDRGDARDISTQLSGTIGFPLRDGATAYVQLGGQLVLRKTPRTPEAADAPANGVGFGAGCWGEAVRHERSVHRERICR